MNEIKLSFDGYSGWVEIPDLNFSSKEELAQEIIWLAQKTDDGKPYFWLSKTTGERIRVVDENEEGVAWFYKIAPEFAADDDEDKSESDEQEEDYVDLIGVQPIFPRSSVSFHLLLWVYAVIVGQGAYGRFAELRRFARSLQFAALYGWSKDLNNALVDGAKGILLAKRAIAFALVQFLINHGKKTFFILFAVFAYAIYTEI